MSNIPVMDDPMGKYWKQSEGMTRVPFDHNHAILTRKQFSELRDYSRSRPSGVYPGKCWKSQTASGDWLLCWYGPDNGDGMLENFVRNILILEDGVEG